MVLKALMRAVRRVAGGLVEHPVAERFELSTEVLNFLQKCFYKSDQSKWCSSTLGHSCETFHRQLEGVSSPLLKLLHLKRYFIH